MLGCHCYTTKNHVATIPLPLTECPRQHVDLLYSLVTLPDAGARQPIQPHRVHLVHERDCPVLVGHLWGGRGRGGLCHHQRWARFEKDLISSSASPSRVVRTLLRFDGRKILVCLPKILYLKANFDVFNGNLLLLTTKYATSHYYKYKQNS